MRALVSGADGFVGRWLTRHLEESGDEVWRLARRPDPGDRRLAADVTDARAVASAIAEAEPEAVYHLAAISYGPQAAREIDQAVAVTVGGTVNLLNACAGQPSPPIVLVTSSAEVYGAAPDGPLDEAHPTAPANAYGATKLAQEAIALAYRNAGAVEVAVTRAFNHIGPGQRSDFVVPAFASQLARIAAGRETPVVRVGNLDAVRDFTDVRDVVAAYRLVVAGRHTGIPLNVASGRGVRVGDLLDRLIEISGTNATVEVDPARLRRVDIPSIVGDAGKLHDLTGWTPHIPLGATLRDVWQDAQARVESE